MLTLNLEQAQELIASVIETHGEDKVYERSSSLASCLYVHKDNDGNLIPGCLVGTALIDYGIDASELYNVVADIIDLADALRRRQILGIDGDAVRYLRLAQQRQDDGETWGDANEAALAYIRGMEDDD